MTPPKRNPNLVMIKQELKKSVQKISSDINTACVVTKHIEESVFIRDFLPIFSGEVTDPAIVKQGVEVWIQLYAGNTSSSVHIVADGTLDVVAVVPMLKARTMFNVTTGLQQNLSRQFMDANVAAATSPVLAENKMMRALAGVAKGWVGSITKANAKLSDEWKALLDRYNKKETPETPQVQQLTNYVERD